MQVILKIDGNCGLHSKVVELPDEIKGMSSVIIGGLNFNLFTSYDADSGEIHAQGYHFVAKDEDDIGQEIPEPEGEI